jgi:hypothetical protein
MQFPIKQKFFTTIWMKDTSKGGTVYGELAQFMRTSVI